MKKIALLSLGFASLLPLSLPATQNADNQAIERAVLVHINQYRQSHHLPLLTMDSRISKQARKHSIDMAEHRLGFGHTYFKQRIERLHGQIKGSDAGAENVAYNYKSAEDVVKNWLRSPGHKRNIDGHYNLTGIGVVRDARGKLYFTQIFLRKPSGALIHVG
jgi:uncharacterized protein YkwD